MRYWLRLFFSSFLTPCFRSDDICLIWSIRRWGGGAILLRTHEARKWTAAESGPTSSALGGPNAYIRRALCCVWSTATPVVLVMRSLPRKMRPEQRKPLTYFCSLCFFQGDSRSPPDFAPHSKAIKILMRFWLRVFFRPS